MARIPVPAARGHIHTVPPRQAAVTSVSTASRPELVSPTTSPLWCRARAAGARQVTLPEYGVVPAKVQRTATVRGPFRCGRRPGADPPVTGTGGGLGPVRGSLGRRRSGAAIR
ncbi:hypothetical protein GCM10009727_44010 [Actinomadura napierensis]|uniref:Uncharacterized protein n=1 Tax=Actinomadura napierensis TaxID=267854 RepID=A0ABN2ZM87_9ACTN